MNFHDALREVDREDGRPTTAHEDLERQLADDREEIHCLSVRGIISLHSMWRTVGCPAGKDPASWLAIPEVRDHLLSGEFSGWGLKRKTTVADLVLTLEWARPTCTVAQLVNETESFWFGDMLAMPEVAYVYARFLDGDDANG